MLLPSPQTQDPWKVAPPLQQQPNLLLAHCYYEERVKFMTSSQLSIDLCNHGERKKEHRRLKKVIGCAYNEAMLIYQVGILVTIFYIFNVKLMKCITNLERV